MQFYLSREKATVRVGERSLRLWEYNSPMLVLPTMGMETAVQSEALLGRQWRELRGREGSILRMNGTSIMRFDTRAEAENWQADVLEWLAKNPVVELEIVSGYTRNGELPTRKRTYSAAVTVSPLPLTSDNQLGDDGITAAMAYSATLSEPGSGNPEDAATMAWVTEQLAWWNTENEAKFASIGSLEHVVRELDAKANTEELQALASVVAGLAGGGMGLRWHVEAVEPESNFGAIHPLEPPPGWKRAAGPYFLIGNFLATSNHWTLRDVNGNPINPTVKIPTSMNFQCGENCIAPSMEISFAHMEWNLPAYFFVPAQWTTFLVYPIEEGEDTGLMAMAADEGWQARARATEEQRLGKAVAMGDGEYV